VSKAALVGGALLGGVIGRRKPARSCACTIWAKAAPASPNDSADAGNRLLQPPRSPASAPPISAPNLIWTSSAKGHLKLTLEQPPCVLRGRPLRGLLR
jgi:hypothetical protein